MQPELSSQVWTKFNLFDKMSKVAVVTGSNKGIGLAIVKGLVAKFEGDVYLTSRSEERGLAAVEQLKKVIEQK